jgi:hypothetical protein
MDLMTEMAPIWLSREYIAGALLDVDELVQVLDSLLRLGPSASVPTIAVVPRRPA